MLSAESGLRRRIMLAATLALAGGLVAGSGMAIMQAAGVSAGLLRLQALFLVVSLLLLGLGVFAQGRLSRPGTLLALCAVLAASLLLPWLAGGGAQARWLALGGFRLHLAPVVLPALLVLLGGLLDHAGFRGQRAALAVLGVAGIALMLQPDPAQLLALTLAAAQRRASTAARRGAGPACSVGAGHRRRRAGSDLGGLAARRPAGRRAGAVDARRCAARNRGPAGDAAHGAKPGRLCGCGLLLHTHCAGAAASHACAAAGLLAPGRCLAGARWRSPCWR